MFGRDTRQTLKARSTRSPYVDNRDDSFASFDRRFNIMRNIVFVFIALTFIAVIVGFVLMLTGHLPFHYSITQTWGNTSYHEEYGTN